MMNRFLLTLMLILLTQNGFAAGLKLIKSQNDELCNHIQSIFQKDFDNHGSEQFLLHKEYNWVAWVPGEYLLTGGLHQKVKKFMSTKIDINNDGKIETILLETRMIFAKEISELLVVGDDSYNVNTELEFTIEEMIKIPGIKASEKWPYRLDIESLNIDEEFYKGNSRLTLVDIHPFKFDGVIYLSMVRKYEVDAQPKWHVIVKYSDEQFPIGRGDRRSTSKLEHICYFDSISSEREN